MSVVFFSRGVKLYTKLRQILTDHPRAVGESYWQHLRAALGLAGYLAVTLGILMCHAVLPGLYVTRASERVTNLHHRMHNRRPTSRQNA